MYHIFILGNIQISMHMTIYGLVGSYSLPMQYDLNMGPLSPLKSA